MNFRKSKWFLFGAYYPLPQNDQYFFKSIDKVLATYSNYDNVLIAENFNAEDDEPCLNNFLNQDGLNNLVKIGTCFKSSSKRTSIDLFLTTKTKHFWNTVAVCSGLSEFGKLVLMVLKISFEKNKPCEYRDYKQFDFEYLK